ncbi:hypothetical protein ACP3WZ_26585, partial [Salmonella enterica]|uniref:hypothetical protein n=1 Tax=Salmonella enterica TaxID=28901 RepID=UPI003CFA68B3
RQDHALELELNKPIMSHVLKAATKACTHWNSKQGKRRKKKEDTEVLETVLCRRLSSIKGARHPQCCARWALSSAF